MGIFVELSCEQLYAVIEAITASRLFTDTNKVLEDSLEALVREASRIYYDIQIDNSKGKVYKDLYFAENIYNRPTKFNIKEANNLLKCIKFTLAAINSDNKSYEIGGGEDFENDLNTLSDRIENLSFKLRVPVSELREEIEWQMVEDLRRRKEGGKMCVSFEIQAK